MNHRGPVTDPFQLGKKMAVQEDSDSLLTALFPDAAACSYLQIRAVQGECGAVAFHQVGAEDGGVAGQEMSLCRMLRRASSTSTTVDMST